MIAKPSKSAPSRATIALVAASRTLLSTRCGVHDQARPYSIAARDSSAIRDASDGRASPTS
jgi:hypothetical protein